MQPYQQAQIATLIDFISRSTGSFVHVLRDPSGVVALIVNAVCKARTLSFSIRNKILPEDVRALFGGCTPSDGHRTRIMKIQRSEWLRQVRLFRAYLRAQMHRTYESYAAEIHFRKHLRLADQMIEFHWKLQLRLLRDLVDKVRVSATSNVHVAEGICLPDFVLEVLGLGPKFAVQPQKNKPELVSIVRQVSKRVPEDQATRIINEDEKTCWCYEPRASKPLLQFHSAHTKLVKRGIAKMCLSEALKKSCRCLMNESFRQQVSRLSNAGYPKSLVVSVAEGLHRKVLEKRCEGMDRLITNAFMKSTHAMKYEESGFRDAHFPAKSAYRASWKYCRFFNEQARHAGPRTSLRRFCAAISAHEPIKSADTEGVTANSRKDDGILRLA
ncbi:hypothetical protein HPB51_000158 [Rhipicephalus microplus]|uniref:Tick transposon n=1 Tax=Rhipicephalus microplus TaxID=6941 RepID=A0A9J6EQQ1_RHIMP|nr:hypothetical protein HPB51_000158 [Rhipicephalus microplus]